VSISYISMPELKLVTESTPSFTILLSPTQVSKPNIQYELQFEKILSKSYYLNGYNYLAASPVLENGVPGVFNFDEDSVAMVAKTTASMTQPEFKDGKVFMFGYIALTGALCIQGGQTDVGDLESGSVSPGPALTVARGRVLTLTIPDESFRKIYIVGGYQCSGSNAVPSNVVEVLNVDSMTITRLNDLPSGFLVSGEFSDGVYHRGMDKFIVASTISGDVAVYLYDYKSDSWEIVHSSLKAILGVYTIAVLSLVNVYLDNKENIILSVMQQDTPSSQFVVKRYILEGSDLYPVPENIFDYTGVPNSVRPVAQFVDTFNPWWSGRTSDNPLNYVVLFVDDNNNLYLSNTKNYKYTAEEDQVVVVRGAYDVYRSDGINLGKDFCVLLRKGEYLKSLSNFEVVKIAIQSPK